MDSTTVAHNIMLPSSTVFVHESVCQQWYQGMGIMRFKNLSQFRFRYMEKPSQFGGTDCIETLWDRLACPAATTQCLVPDYCGESFTCKETGKSHHQPIRYHIFLRGRCSWQHMDMQDAYLNVGVSESVSFQDAVSANLFAVMGT